MITTTPYSLQMTLPYPLEVTERQVRSALLREDFGIIMEIDIAAKLKEMLGIEHAPHKILGACHLKLAHDALVQNVDVALALPCSVVLREEAGRTHVSAMLPSIALKPFQGLSVQSVACTTEEGLKRAFEVIDRESLS